MTHEPLNLFNGVRAQTGGERKASRTAGYAFHESPSYFLAPDPVRGNAGPGAPLLAVGLDSGAKRSFCGR
jgi:hypothetical protein